MDPLSIPMAVISATGAAITTYKEIFKFINVITNAPKEIHAISADTENIYAIISNLHSALQERKIRDVIAQDVLAQKHVQGLEGPLGSCNETLRGVTDKLREHFRPVGNGKEYKLRFQWWKAKDDFQQLLTKLSYSKETLSLSMVGLNTLTLRALGESAVDDIDESMVVNHSTNVREDPAATLRNYANSVIASYGTGNTIIQELELPPSHADIEPSPASTSRSKSETSSAAPLSLDAKRNLARERRKRQSDLLEAAKTGDDIEVEILLAEGAEVDWWDPAERKTALHLAAQYGHTLIAKVLLDHGADIEAHCDPPGPPSTRINFAGRTPLHWAAAGFDTGGRQESIVRFLLRRGADVMARTTSNRTTLHAAVNYPRTGNNATPVVQLLLENGAMINACDSCGWTPLHVAATHGKQGIAQILLEHGAQVDGRPNEVDQASATNPEVLEAHRINAPLLFTRHCVFPRPTIQLLIQFGANIYVRTAEGETLLHLGAEIGKASILLALLNAGMDVNVKETTYGHTALHRAAWEGKKDAIEVLLQRGADIHMKNNFGRDAIQHARANGNEEAARLLEQHTDPSHPDRTSLEGSSRHDHNEEQLSEKSPSSDQNEGSSPSESGFDHPQHESLHESYDETLANHRDSQMVPTENSHSIEHKPRSNRFDARSSLTQPPFDPACSLVEI